MRGGTALKSVFDLATEGDVETQVVLQVLTKPEFLGIPIEDIRSKSGISARAIGKGAKRKIGYVPDFCVYKKSLPVIVIEAKAPHNDVEQAYSEARLYAHEINSDFPAGLNPCCRVLATDGKRLLVGSWDAAPALDLRVEEIAPGTQVLDDLRSLLGQQAIEDVAVRVSGKLRSPDFKRPFNQGAGEILISSRIEPNSFSADLAPILRRYFSSKDNSKEFEIYSRAYVSSNEVTGYDRILQSFLKERLSRAKKRTAITTTKNKSDLVSRAISNFGENRPSSGDIQLVTGGVGVGKSLFARRYKEYLQPDAIKDKNHWAFLDFNNSPQDHSKWESWVCEQFVRSIVEEGAPINLRAPDDQERVFASDLEDRRAFYDRMEAIQTGRGSLERARDIEQWRQDPKKSMAGISRYLQGDRAENIIVVFDNVDRRESASQLAAFELALWFMDQTRCMVILQMRDSTFENYKHRPPLDTFRTGQIFHISPPRFIDVVRKRLELSLDSLNEEAPELVKFKTSGGMTVTYPKSWAGDFLRGIYEELFVRPNNLSRVLEALAGRNVRTALDMFMAILTSGHMPEEVIVSVAQGTGFKKFPEYRTLRALMRQDYRFFNHHSGFVGNIFNCDSKWERPSNLLIPELMFFLLGQRKVKGDNGQMGFVALPRLLQNLEGIGFVREDIKSACEYCLRKGLVEVETSSQEIIRERDSLKATAAGWAHMRILSSRLEYLYAVLPTTPMNDAQLSARVFDLMQTENRKGQLPFYQTIGVVEGFLQYIEKQEKSLRSFPGYVQNRSGSRYIIGKIGEAVNYARRQNATVTGQPDLLDY